LELVFRLSKASDPPDGLEQNLLLVLLAGIITGQDQAEHILTALQQRVRGQVSSVWADSVTSIFGSRRGSVLVPEATPEIWPMPCPACFQAARLGWTQSKFGIQLGHKKKFLSKILSCANRRPASFEL
jgi:hypothetical protein